MKRELLLRLQSEIEIVTDAWLSTALKSLLHIQSRSEQKTLNVKVMNISCEKMFSVLNLFG